MPDGEDRLGRGMATLLELMAKISKPVTQGQPVKQAKLGGAVGAHFRVHLGPLGRHAGPTVVELPDSPQNRRLLGRDEVIGKLLKMFGSGDVSNKVLEVYYVSGVGARPEFVWFADSFHSMWEWRADPFTTGEYTGRHRAVPT